MAIKAIKIKKFYLLDSNIVVSFELGGKLAIFRIGFKLGIGSDGATISYFSHDKGVININEKRINVMLKFFFMALKFN